MNQYAYARGNPVNGTDRAGLKTEWECHYTIHPSDAPLTVSGDYQSGMEVRYREGGTEECHAYWVPDPDPPGYQAPGGSAANPVGNGTQAPAGAGGQDGPGSRTGEGDKASPVDVGVEWLTGKGERKHNFKDGDPFAELLKEHENIQLIAQQACNGDRPPSGSAGYDLSGLKGVPKYARDYSTVATLGATGNLAATYLGSYNGSYRQADGRVQFHIENTSSLSSALRPPVLGYSQWWQQNVGSRLDGFFSSGPMSPTTQTFDFSVSCGAF